MDIDDDLYGNSTTNGFTNHETVSNSSTTTNQILNGHSLLDDDNIIIDKTTNNNGSSTKTKDILDGMDCDGNGNSTHTVDMETTLTDGQKEDDQLLLRILQFGRELHALKQQLNTEHGENTQHDKSLQV